VSGRGSLGVVPAPDAVRNEGDGTPDLVVIAVTFNSVNVVPAFLGALPDALEGVRSARVYVADNGSTDGTVERISETAPWVRVRQTGRNLGYAGGINFILREELGTQGVLVLNPDAIPSSGFARHLLDGVEKGADIAVPRIVDDRGNLKFSLRREPTLARAVGEAVLGGHRAARFNRWGDMIRDPARYVNGATADWATGAAMLISRPVLDTVGLWDESFFLYSEETEYALRARKAGFTVRFVSAAEVMHPGGAMSRSPELWSLLAVNRVRLYRCNHGRLATAAYWLVVVLNEATRASLGRPTHRAALRALLRPQPRHGPGEGNVSS
jgi:N-acetylglucosaminyl-diphospho-decaprenol L-rhamnosyltransferase